MFLPLACLKRYFLKVLQRLSEFAQHYQSLKSSPNGHWQNRVFRPSIQQSLPEVVLLNGISFLLFLFRLQKLQKFQKGNYCHYFWTSGYQMHADLRSSQVFQIAVVRWRLAGVIRMVDPTLLHWFHGSNNMDNQMCYPRIPSNLSKKYMFRINYLYVFLFFYSRSIEDFSKVQTF